jgi:hypothetical protein
MEIPVSVVARAVAIRLAGERPAERAFVKLETSRRDAIERGQDY